MCFDERKELLANHDSLVQHITKVHSVSIEQYNFSFRNMEEFEAWRTQEGREVDYAYTTSVNRPNGEKSIGILQFRSMCLFTMDISLT
jgi:hypothetical protein